jgi:4-hydroxybenzoate polyprenyltransferase
VAELLEAIAKVAAYAALIGLAGWGLQRLLGWQLVGLPGLIGVLVVFAGAQVFSNSGVRGLIATLVCLFAVALVIGMAMSLGADRPDRPEEQRPPDDA